MYHGIINVYKEAGYTSHDVVARLRGICKQKKIGHTGTLDPDAVGVLPVCLGSGTRLCDMLTDKDKEYVAKLRLGITTDTQDISGRVLEEKPAAVSKEEALAAIISFQGEYLQIPPMYSALKVNGRKLYELAREGKEVERAARPVTFYSIEVLEAAHPDYTIRVCCSKGTYIRTLCHDIGQKLGCGGVMTGLTRTRSGGFGIEEAVSLDTLQNAAAEGTLEQWILPVDRMFEKLPAFFVKEESLKLLENGNQLRSGDIMRSTDDFLNFRKAEETGERDTDRGSEAGEYRVYDAAGKFYGIYRYDIGRRFFSPVKMFLEN